MWAVMNSIPDVSEYYAIFDDYLDFDIRPWDTHGYDQGIMIPERKVAIRYLVLAMNIHKSDPALLPTNLLSFMGEYQKPEFKEPDKLPPNVKRWVQKKTKYSDLRKEVIESQQGQGQQHSPIIVNPQDQTTSLSRKDLEGFDMKLRVGSAPSDVLERVETKLVGQGKMGPRYIDTTTRSVFFDVPGEDAISPQTWDAARYMSREDVQKVNKAKGGAKAK